MSHVTFAGKNYPVTDGESVLDALIRGGAGVAFSCRKGSCHTCMLRCADGSPDRSSQKTLRTGLIDSNHFLPCVSHAKEPMAIEPPDLSLLFVTAVVGRIEKLGQRVVRVGLEPEIPLTYRPGQYFNLRRADGLTRSYSTRGFTDEDYFLEFDIQRAGVFSSWVHDTLAVGDEIQLQGPLGSTHYTHEAAGQPLLLVGTGTGIAPLRGIAVDALRNGHTGPIYLYYGARRSADLYAHDELLDLKKRGVNYSAVVLEGGTGEQLTGDLTQVVFDRHPDLTGWQVFLCGDPDLVQRLRCGAVLAGARRENTHVDPFESSAARTAPPRDAEIVASIGPDPEMWQALGEGDLLREILEDFYTQVYADARLHPFFHNVTKERAVSKQHEFLRDLFSGTRDYFGEKPFNAHHWMVISDELFDYREALFETTLRKHGLAEKFIRRWLALHERFRREIVKTTARGLVRDGVERDLERFTFETLGMAYLCDGCGGEMQEGSTGRLHSRTGKLFCNRCDAVTV